jgi:glutamine---fructose-6-phosphate transaminase (isomerizing)
VRHALAARDGGALVIGLINVEGSPLGAAAEHEVPLCAGPELAVAATKSMVMAALAGLAVVAGCTADDSLAAELALLPQRLDQAAQADWSALTRLLPTARAAYVVGRGCDLGVAKELALKVAETVGVPALAFSSAEFLHGPLAAVSAQTPVLGIATERGELASVLTALERARGQGARTLLAHGFKPAADVPRADLWLPNPRGSSADALLALVPAYLAIEAAAVVAGRDPDRPAGLAKVTQTL